MRFDLARLLNPLDEHGVTRIDKYEAKIGPLHIWTGNYPHAYAHPYSGPEILPSLKTRRRIHNLLIKELAR